MKSGEALAAIAALSLALVAGEGPAKAENYPAKPVMIVTPAGAGSSPDVITRIVADRLTQSWGQQVLVVNRPGGGGIIAAHAVSTAARDGYTLYMAIASTFVGLPETEAKLPFDLRRDIAPIGLVGEMPMVIAVRPSPDVTTLTELIALAKNRPRQILFGGGRTTVPHLTGLLLGNQAGIDLTFVSYPTSAKAVNDVIGGTLTFSVEGLAAQAGAIEGGSLKPLAVASAERLPNLPDVPTVAETIPGFEARGWFALMAPAGIPESIVRKVNLDLRAVLEQGDVRQKMAKLGTYARPTSPAETAEFIRREQDLWRPVVKQAALAPN
jgi:tripartite-type tricarboxylate transporter receptor subunit TctC